VLAATLNTRGRYGAYLRASVEDLRLELEHWITTSESSTRRFRPVLRCSRSSAEANFHNHVSLTAAPDVPRAVNCIYSTFMKQPKRRRK